MVSDLFSPVGFKNICQLYLCPFPLRLSTLIVHILAHSMNTHTNTHTHTRERVQRHIQSRSLDQCTSYRMSLTTARSHIQFGNDLLVDILGKAHIVNMCIPSEMLEEALISFSGGD